MWRQPVEAEFAAVFKQFDRRMGIRLAFDFLRREKPFPTHHARNHVIKERYHRPTITLAPDQDGMLRGSGRSIAGVHLRDVLDLVDKRHPGMLVKFGGHAMAAGLTLPADRLDDFRQALEDAVRTLARDDCFERDVTTDGALPADAIHIFPGWSCTI